MKKHNDLIRLSLILFAVTFVVSLALGSVNAATKEQIVRNTDKLTRKPFVRHARSRNL